MANTVYGPYSPTTWVDNVTLGNQTRMNNLETQASIGTHALNPDLFTPFILSGINCTKDGSVANQLDIASGRAYLQMTDGTIGLIVVGADNTHTTSTPSTTYYLDLNPDGTWSWATSHSVVANHLTICSVTTDGAGNISAVTMNRQINTTLLSGMLGALTLPVVGGVAGQATAGSYGVPVVIGAGRDVHVTVNTLTTIATATTPNDGINHILRVAMHADIGAGNTNNGSCTMDLQYTDARSGFSNITLASIQGGVCVTISALAESKGNTLYGASSGLLSASPNTTVTLAYQNAAAGTISDYVNAIIELLA